MRARWIVLNPSMNWIQGDIAGGTPLEAAREVEAAISVGVRNPTWEVYAAPPGFPAADAEYSGGDPDLLASLKAGRAHVFPNARANEGLAIAC